MEAQQPLVYQSRRERRQRLRDIAQPRQQREVRRFVRVSRRHGFSADQYASGTVYKSGMTGGYLEIELQLRVSDSANSTRGYECFLHQGGAYISVARWRGTALSAPASISYFDILGAWTTSLRPKMATFSKRRLSATSSPSSSQGKIITTVDVSKFDGVVIPSGDPGIGFDAGGSGAETADSSYGFKDFSRKACEERAFFSVIDRSTAQVDDRAGHRAGQIRCQERGRVGELRERGHAPEVRHALEACLKLGGGHASGLCVALETFADRRRLRDRVRHQAHHPDPLRCELGREACGSAPRPLHRPVRCRRRSETPSETASR